MDIKMDQVDEFALRGALDRLEAILCDMTFLANEREWHSIRAMADDAIDAVRTARYALKM
jgi:hypothetical protein